MMKTICSICLIFLFFHTSFAQENALFLIGRDGLIGFMNSKGEEIIPCKFVEAGKFINGLAWVREGGYYGYIDEMGKYIIPPIYDFADDFKGEYHIVYGDGGTPICFNRKGEQISLPNYDDLYYLENELFKVYTKTEKVGIINVQGKLVVDTVFSWIDVYMEDGVALVEKYLEDDEEGYFQYAKTGVIDLKGNFIVPYDSRFLSIYSFIDGYAIANDTISGKDVYIDLKGNILPLPANYVVSNHDFFYRNHKDGALLIEYNDSTKMSYEQKPLGLMDKHGKLLVPHGKYDYFSDFNKGRAFAGKEDKYYLINSKGELIVDQSFENFFQISSPTNLCCLVKTKDLWGALDTLGRFVLDPQIQANEVYFIDSVLFYTNDTLQYDKIWNIWDLKTKHKANPQFYFSPNEDFKNGLISAWNDSSSVYINTHGEVVQQIKRKNRLRAINLTTSYYKPHTYCNPRFAKQQAIPENHFFERNKFSIKVQPNEDTLFYQQRATYQGIALYMVNETKDTIKIDTRRDGMLLIVIEALDKQGKWKRIESWLSDLDYNNGKENIAMLNPQHYWKFSMPKYAGGFKTLLRAKLSYVRQVHSKEKIIIYSNEFEGTINPAQFWRNDWIWK